MQPSGVRIHVAESGQVRQSIGSNAMRGVCAVTVCDGDGDPSVKKCDKIQMTDSVHGVGLGVKGRVVSERPGTHGNGPFL